MSHLASFRKGWQSENLARFLLSKFSFISHPSTVSDDIGSDFFCTLFRIVRSEGHDYLVPKSSFAIQIKSNDKKIDVSNKIDYLMNLEIPFFVGVVDRQRLALSVYSGEGLPLLFSQFGRPKDLKIELSKNEVKGPQDYYIQDEGGGYVLCFPWVSEIKATTADYSFFVDALEERCSAMHRNISSKINDEYIFDLIGTDPPSVVIFAGQGSVRGFRENFFKRLAECFYNLEWISINRIEEFKESELVLFQRIYALLKDEYLTLPVYLTGPFQSSKSAVSVRPELILQSEGAASIMLTPEQQTLLTLFVSLPDEKKNLLMKQAHRFFEETENSKGAA